MCLTCLITVSTEISQKCRLASFVLMALLVGLWEFVREHVLGMSTTPMTSGTTKSNMDTPATQILKTFSVTFCTQQLGVLRSPNHHVPIRNLCMIHEGLVKSLYAYVRDIGTTLLKFQTSSDERTKRRLLWTLHTNLSLFRGFWSRYHEVLDKTLVSITSISRQSVVLPSYVENTVALISSEISILRSGLKRVSSDFYSWPRPTYMIEHIDHVSVAHLWELIVEFHQQNISCIDMRNSLEMINKRIYQQMINDGPTLPWKPYEASNFRKENVTAHFQNEFESYDEVD